MRDNEDEDPVIGVIDIEDDAEVANSDAERA